MRPSRRLNRNTQRQREGNRTNADLTLQPKVDRHGADRNDHDTRQHRERETRTPVRFRVNGMTASINLVESLLGYSGRFRLHGRNSFNVWMLA